MRLRELYTNGKSTYDFCWLEHNGTDVHCGPCNVALKRTYHRSGEVHTTVQGRNQDQVKHLRLSELHGGWCLISVAFKNDIALSGGMNWAKYTSKAADAVFTIDGRTVPGAASVQVDLGVCEVGNLKGVPQLPGFGERLVRSLQFRADVTPWVYCAVIW